MVGVYPTHRRRGALRAMMRAQIDDVRRRGEPLAALWASEATIYGRFGYGMASFSGSFELPSEHTRFAVPRRAGGRVRIVSPEEALDLLPQAYDPVRAVTPGMVSRSRAWWETRVVADPPERRGGGGPKRFALLDLDGRPRGYAIYRHNAGFSHGVTTAKLSVIEAVAEDGFCHGRDLALPAGHRLAGDDRGRPAARGPPPVPPALNPRRMGFRVGDALWVRIVDVETALAARSYAADSVLVFDLADEFAPWNEGRFRLAGGRAERTAGEPDLKLDIQALGSVYLGGFTFADLARAGRVAELRPGALARGGRNVPRGAPPLVPRDLLERGRTWPSN